MIIYSVTVSIDVQIEADWVQWMKEVHIPDVMATGLFLGQNMHRLIDPPPHTPGTATYNIQYELASMPDYVNYQENHAAALQEDHTSRYKDRFVAFRTILERI